MFQSSATGHKDIHSKWHRVVACLLLTLITAFAISGITQAKAVYVIYDGNTCTTVESRHYSPSAIVEEAGIQVSAADQISASGTEDGTTEINITRGQRVYVSYDGATMGVYAYQETVDHLLTRLGIVLDEADVVSIDVSEKTTDEMLISVNNIDVEHKTVQEAIAYKTVRTADASLAAGTEKVTVEGKNGAANVTYAITYENRKEISREALSRETISEPVTQKVTYGTKSAAITSGDRISNVSANKDGSGVLTFKSGGTLSYKKAITCTATAYTASSSARTATGTKVSIGTVAVDPSVIPLGSKLYIQTTNGSIVYGTAVARDTGGAIKGNKVDLFYDSYNQCIQFGRRSCSVYILN